MIANLANVETAEVRVFYVFKETVFLIALKPFHFFISPNFSLELNNNSPNDIPLVLSVSLLVNSKLSFQN